MKAFLRKIIKHAVHPLPSPMGISGVRRKPKAFFEPGFHRPTLASHTLVFAL